MINNVTWIAFALHPGIGAFANSSPSIQLACSTFGRSSCRSRLSLPAGNFSWCRTDPFPTQCFDCKISDISPSCRWPSEHLTFALSFFLTLSSRKLVDHPLKLLILIYPISRQFNLAPVVRRPVQGWNVGVRFIGI